MKVTLESTDKIVHINGVPARVWEGVTERGIRMHAFITRVAVDKISDVSEFERDLQEHSAPSKELEAIPLRMVL